MSRKISLAASVLTIGLVGGVVVPAQAATAPSIELKDNSVVLTIPSVQIPGLPQGQLPMPKLPTIEQVRQEGGKFATELDKLLATLNQAIEAQEKASGELNETEKQLTNARNAVHAAISEHGAKSEEAKTAKADFASTRKDVVQRGQDGDEEAKRAIASRDSKKLQKDASAETILSVRSNIDEELADADLDESKFVEPQVTDDGEVAVEKDKPITEETSYYVDEENSNKEKEKEDKRKSDSESKSLKKSQTNEEQTAKSAEKQKKKEYKKKVLERAERAAGVPESPEESPWYAYGNYDQPFGNVSLIDPKLKDGYDNLADVDTYEIITRFINQKDNAEIKESVKELRKADQDGDTAKFNEAREKLQPVIETVGQAMYSWDDDIDKNDERYQTIIGDDGSPFNPYEDVTTQEDYENLVVDLILTPSSVYKKVVSANKKKLAKDTSDSKNSNKSKDSDDGQGSA